MFTLFAIVYAYPVATGVFVGLLVAAVIFEKIIRFFVCRLPGLLSGIVYATLRMEYESETDRVALLHVSQGAAMMVLSVAYVRWEFGSYALIWSPPDLTFACLFAMPFLLIGLARVIGGVVIVRQYPFNFLPVVLAMVRIALAVLLYRYGVQYWVEYVASPNSLVIVFVPALWLLVTGIARLLIVSGLIYGITLLGARGYRAIRKRIDEDEPIHGKGGISRK